MHSPHSTHLFRSDEIRGPSGSFDMERAPIPWISVQAVTHRKHSTQRSGHEPRKAVVYGAAHVEVGAGGSTPVLAVFFEQCLKTAYDLGNDFLRDSSDPGSFERPPVQALHLVRPHHTRHGQSRR